MWMSPEYWGCPECGNGEAWLLCNGGIMCADDDCRAKFAGIAGWIAGRDTQDPQAAPAASTAGE